MKIIVLSFTIMENVPLAAGYVVAAARADEITGKNNIELWDEACEDYKDNNQAMQKLCKRIIDAQPDMLAFSSYVWNLKICLEMAALVKSQNQKITTVFGGPGATFTATYLLDRYQGVDYVIRGEGEKAFVELLHAMMKGEKIDGIKSLSWKHDGKIIETPNRPGIENLDEVPSPYLSGVLEPKNDIIIETHRGCIFKCGYCQEARGYPGIRPFSVRRVEQEIEWAETRGVKRISFVNSIYNINPKRTEELSLMLAKHKSGIQFSIDTFAMLINERTADLYEKAGIYGTDIGLQSTNRQAIINMKRPWIEPEKFREMHKMLKDRGIRTSIHLILGLPGDNFETFKKSYAYTESIEPTTISVFRLLVLPGTPFYQERKKFSLISNPDPPFAISSSSTFSADEIKLAETYVEAKYKEFLMKNSYRQMLIDLPAAPIPA
ncbi:MAG: radical SAM protein [Nanoarchaeota archaeon]|nr:MAG: radical SAM protein [Nanoarchaeota archaeon]